jgi:hypothetical protein
MVNMSEVTDIPAPKPSDAVARLEEAKTKSGWFAWAGLGLAFLWWVSGIVGTISLVGMTTIGATQPALILAGLIAIILPGLMLVMAGLMAREQSRSSAANAIVLEAAARLLMPGETMAGEATAFATEMAKASSEVDRSMGHALSAMKAMSGEIGDERARLESVTYASADNARELADRLGNERNGIEQLAKDLREQTTMLNEAIPKQAKLMVESATAAADEVASAEEALQSRLASLDQTGRTLAQKIAAMDTLAAEAGQRNETLLFAIARMEEKLEQSRKTVEAAARAGELAAAAAGTTGDRLTDSVKAALESAKEASSQIQRQTFEASESAAHALAELKEAGQQAASAVRAAGMAARAEMDIAERRATQASQALYKKTQTVETDLATETSEVIGDFLEEEITESEADTTAAVTSPSRAVEDDLFEASADRMARAMLEEAEADLAKQTEAEPNVANGYAADGHEALNINGVDDVFDDDVDAEPEPKQMDRSNGTHLPATRTNSLSDIIADMEREDRTTLSREETADSILEQLEDSGIRLTDIFRPKDKKKIAFAARKGDQQRRTAINQQAGRQVDRVRKRLRGNLDMMSLARDFLALEEADALNALENTHASSKNASARLATYLLLDAAIT